MTDLHPRQTDVHILLVEDNEADADLMAEAFAENPRTKLTIARTGEEALDIIRDAPTNGRPDMVLLDLNLPKKSGFDVLAELKGDPRSRSIPILILSSSRAEGDVARAYATHANSYLTKPIGVRLLFGMARSVEEYWVSHAQLPPKRTAA